MVESEKPEIDYIRYLKNNLLDSYKYGDGFTVFKELIQNASDAASDSLKVYVLDSLKNANCSEALRTPAIVVYDDGNFDKTNKDGIIKIASDNKTSESTKIGRYGLGMKSIFHICDFFIYAANTKDFPYERVFPVNYWPVEDERFKHFSDEDIELVLNSLPKEVDIRKQKGFMLYIPIKLSKPNWENVISDPIKTYPFGSIESLRKRIPVSLALLSEVAPQEKKLKSIFYSQSGEKLDVSVENKNKVKKIITESSNGRSIIQFVIYRPELSKEILDKVEKLKGSDYWTKEQKDNLKPEICFELLKSEKEDKYCKGKLSINFCVYLPLEEDYCSKSFEIESKYNYTILIHSNFAVDSGRRGIRGFASLLDEATEIGIDSEEGIQKLWNKYLAQKILFPNIPLFLNEVKALISDHNDFCELSNKLYETSFSYSGKEIRLCNPFTVVKYAFANLYGEGWTSFELDNTKSNYIFLPYSKDEKDIQALFPGVKDKSKKFVLKTPTQKFVLSDIYNPDESELLKVINNIPVNSLLEEKFIVALTQFFDYQKEAISNSSSLQQTVISHFKKILSGLSFDDLSKNQTRLSELFAKVNEVTSNSVYKIYSIGQKEKSDFLKMYTIEDFKSFWTKESPFVFVPGFIKIENELLPQLRENVFSGENTVCGFISIYENCRPQLHFNILSSILGSLYESSLKNIAKKYTTLQIFKVAEAFSNKPETLNSDLIAELIKEKKIFMTQSNPSDKDTVFFYYVKTVHPINIYHISKKIRDIAGFGDDEIPSSDDARNVFNSFSELYKESLKESNESEYEVSLDLNKEFWYQLLDEGFKNTFEIKNDEKQFYRFLFSEFNTELRGEPLASFDEDVPDVWKEVYKNIAPDAKKIPIKVPARAKEQIKKNETLLGINYLDTNGCKEKLRQYSLNGNLDFFRDEYFQNPKMQKQLFVSFTSSESDLYKAIPIHISAKDGSLIDATGKAYLNREEIEFPKDCKLEIKLIQISEDPDLRDIQERFLDSLTIKDSVIAALASKNSNADISQWVFDKIRASGNRWKDIFEGKDYHRYFHWLPLKTGRSKTFCDIQDILNDDLFSLDAREWISNHYEMFNLSDLDISSSDIELLKTKKLLAENYPEQMDYIGRQVDKTISFKLNYPDSKTFFSDFSILKDFNAEPVFGLINILKQERKEKQQEVFDFYTQRRVSIEEKSRSQIYEELLNFICDTHPVSQQTLNLYKTFLTLLLDEGNFDISSIKYPSQNNEWKEAQNISASNSSSISPVYLLNKEIYELLSECNEINEDNYVDTKEADDDEIELTDSSDPKFIKELFSLWEASLDKKNLLYLFFYLIKDNFKEIALEKLKEKDLLPLTHDLSYSVLSEFGPSGRLWNAGYSKEQAVMDENSIRGHFRVIVRIPKGAQTKIHSIAGSLLLIDMVDGNEIYTDEPWYYEYNNHLYVSLISTKGRVNNLDEKLEDLIWLIWKKGYHQTSKAEFNKMIQNFKESNQNTIKTAQLFMFENLILHLKDLNLNHPFFKEIFKDYQNLLNEKARKDNSKEPFPEYISRKDELSQKLINYITSDDIETDYFVEDIFNCVVKKIDQAKYDQSRILFELLQNADDAVNDLVENGESIKGRTKFEVIDSFAKDTKRSSIHVSHFGRLINESLNKEKEDRYSNDLLNMLLINSSEKEGRSTGKFGLGFKSVYFVCQEPIIRSGDLQFKILGALYPENEMSDSLRDNETRIELTLNDKADIDLIYGDFEKNAELQTLFCKHINDISIRGTRYKPELQKGDRVGVGLYSSDNRNYLRFGLKTGVLIFKLSQDVNSVESFGESSVSRVWNLTPLATAKTLPFAINSGFEVDIGRKNLDETDKKNENRLQTLAIEFSSVLCGIIENDADNFNKFIPSILDMILNGCGIKDSAILNGFCRKVLTEVYNSKKIIPDGIDNIIKKPKNPYYITPNKFNLDYDSPNFVEFVIRIQSAIVDESVITRNVSEVLSGVLEFNEIDGYEKILNIISGGYKISNKNAEVFVKLINLISTGLPTIFKWESFKVIDSDGDWEPVRNVVLTNSFADEYSDAVVDFFRTHITVKGCFGSNSNTDDNNPPAPDDGAFYNHCTVMDVYNNWKALSKEEWQVLKQQYYNSLFPVAILDEKQRNNDLNILPDYFESYDTVHPTMPKTWCILFMLGNLQSQNYFGESRSEVARKNKIESLMNLITSFSNGNSLDSVYDEYLYTHETDESDLVEFESLLRVYKFRRKFMEIWTQFYGIKHEDFVELNMLINASTAAKASGKGLGTYASQKSLKYGISMIVRELLDRGCFGDNDAEQEKAFDLLNKFTYIPHAYLRRIAFSDWSERPVDRTSEEIHNAILEALEAEKLSEEEIREFMKCHDLPFLILGVKK